MALGLESGFGLGFGLGLGLGLLGLGLGLGLGSGSGLGVRAGRGGERAMPPAMPGDARLGDGAAKQVEELPPARSMPAATGGAAGSGELRPEELLSGSWTSYTS